MSDDADPPKQVSIRDNEEEEYEEEAEKVDLYRSSAHVTTTQDVGYDSSVTSVGSSTAIVVTFHCDFFFHDMKLP